MRSRVGVLEIIGELRDVMISVVICTYNRSESLRRTLGSLAQMTVPNDLRWELLVVDNNSSDDTKVVVETFGRSTGLNVRHVFESRQGHSYARNRGVQEALGDIIAFTDDDVTVDVHWLAQVDCTFAQFDATGIGGRIIPVWTCPKPDWFREDGPYALVGAIVSLDLGDEPREIQTLPVGANMAFTKKAFARYGLFRTDLGRAKEVLVSGEDTEFFCRLMKGGERIIYAAGAIVYHPVAEERVTKNYFLKWYFGGGKTLARLDDVKTVRYLGVPRYLLRSLGESFVKWMFTLEPNRRFFHKLQVYRDVGQIAGSIRRRHSGVVSVQARV